MRFSALQRAENSSMDHQFDRDITQFRVSVLFSEPKIPQSNLNPLRRQRCQRFSALQRAENSSIFNPNKARELHQEVSVLFSEPKIPQCC